MSGEFSERQGGPAFPKQTLLHPNSGRVLEHGGNGMSLRDYFAVHGQEPSQSELLRLAGMVQEKEGIRAGHEGAIVATYFNEWWETLTLEERFALCAKVRYLMADALIKARKE